MYIECENINVNLRETATSAAYLGKSEDKVLICAKFQQPLHLDFGSVRLKEARTLNFSLRNPSTLKSVSIAVDNSLSKSGLTVVIDGSTEDAVVISPLQSCNASIYWTPSSDSTLRESIRFKMDDKAGSLLVIVQGTAGKGEVCFSKVL